LNLLIEDLHFHNSSAILQANKNGNQSCAERFERINQQKGYGQLDRNKSGE
jgi:hypothetical protein